MNSIRNRVSGTCLAAGAVAVLALAGSASAIDGVVSIVPSQSVIMPGGSVQVNAFGRFPASGFALASVSFDSMDTMRKGWKNPSSGVIMGPSVQGAAWSQGHNPFGGPVANSANPIRVWNATFEPESYDPGLLTFTATVSGFGYYPSALTPSAVPATPRVLPGHVLVNPLSVGGVLVAPGEGTTLEPTGPNSIAAESGQEEVILGLLVPAVQKVRDAANRMGDNFRLTFNGQTTAGPRPTESLSLNFTKVVYQNTPMMQVQFDRPGAYYANSCFVGASGVWICLIESGPGGGGGAGKVSFQDLPVSFKVAREYNPASGADTLAVILEWDEPTIVYDGGQAAGQTTRLRIAATSNIGPGLPPVHIMDGGLVTYTGLEQSSAAFIFEPTCLADLTSGAVLGVMGYGVADGMLDNDDFFYFLAQFSNGNLQIADLTGVAVPNQPGYGVPDGQVTNEDFFFYLGLFSQGC